MGLSKRLRVWREPLAGDETNHAIPCSWRGFASICWASHIEVPVNPTPFSRFTAFIYFLENSHTALSEQREKRSINTASGSGRFKPYLERVLLDADFFALARFTDRGVLRPLRGSLTVMPTTCPGSHPSAAGVEELAGRWTRHIPGECKFAVVNATTSGFQRLFRIERNIRRTARVGGDDVHGVPEFHADFVFLLCVVILHDGQRGRALWQNDAHEQQRDKAK